MLKSINIDIALHKKIKVYCAEKGISITQFLHDCLQNALIEEYAGDPQGAKALGKVPKTATEQNLKTGVGPKTVSLAEEFHPVPK